MARSIVTAQSVPVLSQVIATRGDFDRLIHGFQSLRAVSYVVSPELLLELFDARGLVEAEIVVGENLSGNNLVEQYRQTLRRKGPKVTTSLADLVRQDRLKILVPRRSIHSKLYILRGADGYRVIQGSANLTETARAATSQINYVWYTDLPEEHPWLTQVLNDYALHRKDCDLFMGDLADLMRHRSDADTQSLVEAWLSGPAPEAQDSELRKVLQDLTARSLQQIRDEADPLFTIRLPESPRVKREVERILVPMGASSTDHHLTVDSHTVLRYVEQTLPAPLMRVQLAEASIQLALVGQVRSRSEPLADAPTVARALEHIETYLATVDWGRSLDPQFAKTSLFEALLYVLSAPFAHEHMKVRRRNYALIDRRGPRALYIFGPSRNGKSTFMRFALQLLAGEHVNPLSGAQFTKTRVMSVCSMGTVFPLAFDDLDIVRKGGAFEEVLKSYWESWWQEECAVPQLIFTSNAENLKDWAKSRIKRIDFDVHFVPTEKRKAALNQILAQHNPIFKWFAFVYLRKLRGDAAPTDDELQLSREVMLELYAHAGRQVPAFFPDRPLEHTYDPGRKVWHDLLYGLRKADALRQDNRLLITFKDEMQHQEIRGALGHLPQTVKYQLKGKTVVIESPAEFEGWLHPKQPGTESWLARWWRSVRRGGPNPATGP